jgi:hypothetical protein
VTNHTFLFGLSEGDPHPARNMPHSMSRVRAGRVRRTRGRPARTCVETVGSGFGQAEAIRHRKGNIPLLDTIPRAESCTLTDRDREPPAERVIFGSSPVMQSALSAVAAAYALLAAYTLWHLLHTGRRGLQARSRQLGVAALWPAYWLLVHGPSTLVRRGIAVLRSLAVMVILALQAVLRRAIRLALGAMRLALGAMRAALGSMRATLGSMKTAARALCVALRAVWTFAVVSLPARYLRHYRSCRNGGLSRRLTIPFAWTLATLDTR